MFDSSLLYIPLEQAVEFVLNEKLCYPALEFEHGQRFYAEPILLLIAGY